MKENQRVFPKVSWFALLAFILSDPKVAIAIFFIVLLVTLALLVISRRYTKEIKHKIEQVESVRSNIIDLNFDLGKSKATELETGKNSEHSDEENEKIARVQ